MSWFMLKKTHGYVHGLAVERGGRDSGEGEWKGALSSPFTNYMALTMCDGKAEAQRG